MRKVLFKITILLFLFNISFSYSDYYHKVYTVKINKTEIFDFIGASEKQKNSLTKIFDKYQKDAEELSKSTIPYTKKVQNLNTLKKERKDEIYKVLSHEQIQKYNTFINQKKLEFEERNDNISKLLSTLNLTHEQEFDILKSENISSEDFMKQYDDLKNIRNKAIISTLTNEQLNILENNNFNK